MYTPSEINRQYWLKWMEIASAKHKERMLRLVRDRYADREKLLIGDVDGIPTPQHWMYRLEPLMSSDGHRRYEFLIEYDVKEPSLGIYFGCKSHTITGFDHDTEISAAISDWEEIRPSLLLRLNNTFRDMDFSSRFRITDNANDRTFWPFWISLYESEDIVEVGMRALKIIRQTYADYIDGKLVTACRVAKQNIVMPHVATAFTHDAYSRLRDKVYRMVKQTGCIDMQSVIWEAFEETVKWLVATGYMVEENCYEKAWRLAEGYTAIDFHCIVRVIFEKFADMLGCKPDKLVPWTALCDVFLNSDGTAFTSQVKTLISKDEYITSRKIKAWRKIVENKNNAQNDNGANAR